MDSLVLSSRKGFADNLFMSGEECADLALIGDAALSGHQPQATADGVKQAQGSRQRLVAVIEQKCLLPAPAET